MRHFEQILFIGPRSRGGMDAVLAAYQAMLPGARFVTSYRGGSRPGKMADFAAAYAQTAWLLLRHPEIRIVHIHSASNASFRRKMHLARLARRLGRKVVMHIHGGGFRDFMATDPRGIADDLRSCDAVICLSAQWEDFFRSQGVDNVTVIPNPVDYPATVERDPTDGKVHLLYLGVLEKPKGVVDLVEAAYRLSRDILSRVVIHVAGAGSEEECLRQLIESHSLSDSVRLEGWVTGEDKVRLMRLCDCYVLPSYYEGQPVSIIESMARGMAVISTRVGGIPSLVADGHNGLLITPGDTDALAAAITRLVTDDTLRLGMGAASRSLAVPFSTARVAQSLLKLYSLHGIDL